MVRLNVWFDARSEVETVMVPTRQWSEATHGFGATVKEMGSLSPPDLVFGSMVIQESLLRAAQMPLQLTYFVMGVVVPQTGTETEAGRGLMASLRDERVGETSTETVEALTVAPETGIGSFGPAVQVLMRTVERRRPEGCGP